MLIVQQKIGRVNLFCHPYAREGRSEQAVRWPTGAAPISFSPIRWRGGAINRTIDVDRPLPSCPLPSYGVGFGNTGSPQH